MTTAAPPAPPTGITRRWADLGLVAGGCAVLVLAALPTQAAQVPGAEASVFGVLNGTTVLPFVVVWPVMQLGNVLVVPASTVLAAGFRRWRLAAELLVAGTVTYLSAKVVKGIWPRRRCPGRRRVARLPAATAGTRRRPGRWRARPGRCPAASPARRRRTAAPWCR